MTLSNALIVVACVEIVTCIAVILALAYWGVRRR
jgi:hypothetical protein